MKKLLLIAFCAMVSIVSAQNNADVWSFGQGFLLDFNTNPPTSSIGSAIDAGEGVASICDDNGQLLFYSNGGPQWGIQGGVWNRNHQLMPNGALDTVGCTSSMQGCIAVPMPGSTTKYYLFTVDCLEHNYVGGLRYSVIDMTLDGGLGDVIIKQAPLDTINNFNAAGEGLTVIRHANNIDLWVVVWNRVTTDMNAYLVTANGPSVSPVVSPIPVGTEVRIIKPSPSGDLLAIGRYSNDAVLARFDRATGAIGNYRYMGVYNYFEFSPSEQRLYAAEYGFDLVQYDVTAPILSSSKIIIVPSFFSPKPMQLGPDGIIYMGVHGKDSLAAITNPNALGTACNFVEQQVGPFIDGGGGGWIGLPNVFHGYLPQYSEILSVDAPATVTEAITAYPNPFSERVTIQLPWEPTPGSTFTLYNLQGEAVLQVPAQRVLELENLELPVGMYMGQVGYDGALHRVKLVVR